MKRRLIPVVFLVLVMGLSAVVVAEKKESSQSNQQKKEKTTSGSNGKTGASIQPFKPSEEVSADSVISLPTDI